ncbi:MAG: hypothetical protein WCE30_24110 [Mycobacterium sp.]
MPTPTALLRAKHTAASIAVTVAMATALHPAVAPASIPPPTQHRTVSVPAVELAASVTTDGSSQQVGVADAYLYTLNQTDLVDQLNEIRSLGVTDLRIVVPWIYIQPTSSTSYNWSQMDNVINTAHSMGFSMTASITMNPTWDGTPLVGAPNPDTYATFAAAVAQRYGSQISAYEVWNEPNAIESLAPADPSAYTAMLKAAYAAIKAVQPTATVIAGVLGAVTSVPGLSLAPQQFLAGMYADGAQGFFDALSFHPYNYTLPFSSGAGVANSPLEQVEALYALMAANGDAAKQIWATEFGNPTSPGGMDQTQQAQMLRDFVTAWSKLPFAGPAFVYTANDLNSGYLLDENNFGLYTTAGLPKLAAQTLATLISQLATGTLPNYSAPGMSVPQTIWIQLVSTAIAVVNEVLLIPNVAVGVLYNAAPAVLQHVFATVSAAISMAAGAAITAATPLAESAINTVITVGPNIQNAAAAINSAVQNAAQAVGTAAHNTELTVAAAVQSLAAVVAGPNPAGPAPATQVLTAPATAVQNPLASTSASTLALTTAKPATADNASSTVAATATSAPTQPAMAATKSTTTGAAANSSTAVATTTVTATGETAATSTAVAPHPVAASSSPNTTAGSSAVGAGNKSPTMASKVTGTAAEKQPSRTTVNDTPDHSEGASSGGATKNSATTGSDRVADRHPLSDIPTHSPEPRH